MKKYPVSLPLRRLAVSFHVIALTLGLTAWAAESNDSSPRQQLLMDFGWRFHLGDDWGLGEKLDKAGANSGPAGRSFGDASWRKVNLPHDWVIELPFDPRSDTSHGFKPVGPGFHKNDVGWYRRTFSVPETDKGLRFWIQFDGVYRDCRVFFNGWLIGHHESGYSSFRYDVTDLVNCGGENTLSVRVDASEFEGWFYEGAGIYRHVCLLKTSPLAVEPDGIFVYSQFPNNVPEGPATINLEALLKNAQSNAATATVAWDILDPQGKTAARAEQSQDLKPWAAESVLQQAEVSAPVLWSPESPNLYKLITTVTSGGKVVDRTETEFGIRTLAFDADKGFLLNGHPYEVKGTCNHQDHAGVGAALPDALQYFRVRRLKDMGCNAIRTSHNAPTPELLEACDRLGMLVMDENRLLGSDAANMARLEGQVRRDRNHPSVFIWSLFNEENQQGTATGARCAESMQRLAHSLDPTRLCTAAASEGDVFEGVNSVLDVRGWNYHIGSEDSYHKKHPLQPEIGTEQASTLCTRGIYANDKQRGYMSAYDDAGPNWGNTAEAWWQVYSARPWLSGGFVWTGFDYRGEPTPYAWPCINSHFGIMDTCGFAKDNFYYYKAWWGDRPVLHLLPHWNWPGKVGQDIDVRCLGNCDEVELFLNGQSLGHKTMPTNSHLQWSVKYAPGTLLARGFKAGQVIAEDKVETAGAPASIKLSADRTSLHAGDEDASVITVTVTDGQGRVVPLAANLIDFDLAGPGRILGVGNGDPSCHEADTFIASQTSHRIALNDWRMRRVPNPYGPPEVREQFDDSQWDKADAQSDSGPLTPDESAVYRTRFAATPDELAAESIAISFGMIDDEGWVYVNGHLVGESHDWSSQPSFEIRKFLHEGENTVAVAVHNWSGPGGMNKGVALEIPDKPVPVHWKRSVFNGLAQVIVQAGKDAGTLHLTAHGEGLAEASINIVSTDDSTQPLLP
ncbi:MAG: beta-galactosidase GalA [Limisphaerales bacterium]